MSKHRAKRAFQRATIGINVKSIATAIVLFLSTLFVVFSWNGKVEVFTNIETYVISLISTVIGLCIIFTFHYIRDPFIIKKDRQAATDSIRAFFLSVNPEILTAIDSGRHSFSVLLNRRRLGAMDSLLKGEMTQKYVSLVGTGSMSMASSGANFGQDFTDIDESGNLQVFVFEIKCLT